MREYQRDIAQIYMMKESPDNITVAGDYFNYSDTNNAYTGLINESGQFVLSRSIIGHSRLLDAIRDFLDGDDDSVGYKLITNLPDIKKLNEVVNHRIKVRIWGDQKVFSMWDNYKPQYKEAILAAITTIGGNPEEYRYDSGFYEGYGKYEYMATYDDFFVEKLTPEQEAEIRHKEVEVRRGERALADRMAGVKRPNLDLDGPRRQQPAWMRRDGD
jgi:hypothetical protein